MSSILVKAKLKNFVFVANEKKFAFELANKKSLK